MENIIKILLFINLSILGLLILGSNSFPPAWKPP